MHMFKLKSIVMLKKKKRKCKGIFWCLLGGLQSERALFN